MTNGRKEGRIRPNPLCLARTLLLLLTLTLLLLLYCSCSGRVLRGNHHLGVVGVVCVRALESTPILARNGIRSNARGRAAGVLQFPRVTRSTCSTSTSTFLSVSLSVSKSEAPRFSPLAAAERHGNLTRALENAVVVTIDDDEECPGAGGFATRLRRLLDDAERGLRKTGRAGAAVPRVAGAQPQQHQQPQQQHSVFQNRNATHRSSSEPHCGGGTDRVPPSAFGTLTKRLVPDGALLRERLRALLLRYKRRLFGGLEHARRLLLRVQRMGSMQRQEQHHRQRSRSVPASPRPERGTKRHLALLLACVLGGMAGLRPANLTLRSSEYQHQQHNGAILYHERVVHSACHETVASFSSASLPGSSSGKRRQRGGRTVVWRRFVPGWHGNGRWHHPSFHEYARTWILRRRSAGANENHHADADADADANTKTNANANANDPLRGNPTKPNKNNNDVHWHMPNSPSNPIAHQTRSSISLRDLAIFQAVNNSARRSLFTEPSNMTSPSSTSTGEPERREEQTNLSSFDESMRKVLSSIFRIKDETDKQLYMSLIQGRLYKWSMGAGFQAILPRSIQRTLEALTDFVGDLQEKKLDWQNSELYTYDAFSVFRKQRAARIRDVAILNPPSPPPGTAHSQQAKMPDQLKYESWCRKSHDETSFTALQNDSRFPVRDTAPSLRLLLQEWRFAIRFVSSSNNNGDSSPQFSSESESAPLILIHVFSNNGGLSPPTTAIRLVHPAANLNPLPSSESTSPPTTAIRLLQQQQESLSLLESRVSVESNGDRAGGNTKEVHHSSTAGKSPNDGSKFAPVGRLILR
eukprot:jgi/Psemu1/27956/gm1.27956_g